MKKLKPIQKVGGYDGDNECHPMHARQDSAPEKVMFNMQGPLRIDEPLKVEGGDSGKQKQHEHRKQSMQNEK